MSDIDRVSSDAPGPGRVVLRRLKTRPQFLACQKAQARPCGSVLLQMRDRQDGDPAVGVGFTATKKIGGAWSATARSAACARPRAFCFPTTPCPVMTMC